MDLAEVMVKPEFSGLKTGQFRGNHDTLAFQHHQPVEVGGAGHDVQGNIHHPAVVHPFQERPLYPAVEGPHAGAAPDLVVQLPLIVAAVGPFGGKAEVPAENQR